MPGPRSMRGNNRSGCHLVTLSGAAPEVDGKGKAFQATRASLLLLQVTAADRLGWWPRFQQGFAQPKRGKQGAINSSTRGGSVNRARPQPSRGLNTASSVQTSVRAPHARAEGPPEPGCRTRIHAGTHAHRCHQVGRPSSSAATRGLLPLNLFGEESRPTFSRPQEKLSRQGDGSTRHSPNLRKRTMTQVK